jgi:hypothetical protein
MECRYVVVGQAAKICKEYPELSLRDCRNEVVRYSEMIIRSMFDWKVVGTEKSRGRFPDGISLSTQWRKRICEVISPEHP